MDKKYFEDKKGYSDISVLHEKKSYTHFDSNMSMNDCWDYIIDPEKIKNHAFLPFIHYQQIIEKYKKFTEEEQKFNKGKKGKKTFKSRDIYYSSHIDRAIYTYYGAELNEAYNIKLLSNGVDIKNGDDTNSAEKKRKMEKR